LDWVHTSKKNWLRDFEKLGKLNQKNFTWFKTKDFFEDNSLWRLTTLVESEETNTQETKPVLMLIRYNILISQNGTSDK
jgi:hypothetical protein